MLGYHCALISNRINKFVSARMHNVFYWYKSLEILQTILHWWTYWKDIFAFITDQLKSKYIFLWKKVCLLKQKCVAKQWTLRINIDMCIHVHFTISLFAINILFVVLCNKIYWIELLHTSVHQLTKAGCAASLFSQPYIVIWSESEVQQYPYIILQS